MGVGGWRTRADTLGPQRQLTSERAHRGALVAVLVSIVLAASGARAQISPGALARPHAALEGSRNCTQCHGGRAEPTTQRCLACHREIAWLQRQGQGFHARRDARGDCASCHPDHAGRDFELIQWPSGSPERFDHARAAGYALDGSHATAKCTACHTSELRTSPAAQLSPRKTSSGWVGLETDCKSCHTDPHRGTLTDACTRCHDTRKWGDAPGFDHERTDYPLTGKHADVACAKCHLAPRLRPAIDSTGEPVPVFRPVPFKDCVSCHTDLHRSRLTGACSSCHVTSSFRTTNRTAFDHDRTRYPLRGRHVLVPCASCHATRAVASRENATARSNVAARGPGTAVPAGQATDLRPRYQTCADCHVDAHGGQLVSRPDRGACNSCHTVEGWRPSTFGVSAHGMLRLPLDGAHATAACRACHSPERPGLRAATANATAGTARVIMRPPETACAQCHVDPHTWLGRWAAEPSCTACHSTRAFRPTTMGVGDHASTGYALEGAHRAVPCVSCHETANRPRPRSTLVAATPSLSSFTLRATASTCAGCHTDPHGGRFQSRGGDACDRCHAIDAFTPAPRFDHARDARFPLTGAHARASCAACHRQSAGANPRTPRTYAGLSARCESCHAGATGRSRGGP